MEEAQVTERSVDGSGKLRLHVDEIGAENTQAILFIHGGINCRLCWDRQMYSNLNENFHLAAMDLRGHGYSEKPRDGVYDKSEVFADDINNVIESLSLHNPVIVAWSLGGFKLFDYLEHYGEDGIGGINLVGAVIDSSPEERQYIGDDIMEIVANIMSVDAMTRETAIWEFTSRMPNIDLPPRDLYYYFGHMTHTPPYVHEATTVDRRGTSHQEILPKLDTSVLRTHGGEDEFVRVELAEKHVQTIPNAKLSVYPKAGHLPFWEFPDRFNSELREFVSGIES